MKDYLFTFRKIERGWLVYSKEILLGQILRVSHRGYPWAKFLIQGDCDTYGSWFERRDEAAFELFMRKRMVSRPGTAPGSTG